MENVTIDEMEALRAELAHYKAEKEKIRDIVGQIGGKTGHRRRLMINGIFLFLVTGAFTFDVLRSLLDWNIPHVPPLLLLEIAVLLVSLKIIWMIHVQTKVDHFQFWILHSIEFQMNMLSRRIGELPESTRPEGKAATQHNPGSKTASSPETQGSEKARHPGDNPANCPARST